MENPLKGIKPGQKKALVVVGVGAAAFVTYKWFTNSSSADTAPTTVTSSTDADGAATGIIGSNVGGDENVGNSSNSGSSLITTNDAWFNLAVDRLSNAGWNEQVVQSALGEFLAGNALDSSEATIARAAVGAAGYPPNGPTSIKEAPGVTDASKLKAPTGLKVTATTDSSVDLSWLPVDGATQYRVYRSGASQNVGASADTKAHIGGLEPGKSYTFYVAGGVLNGKMGPRSSGVTAKTEARKLKAPTGLKVSKITKNSAYLTWTPTYPYQYLIRRSGSSSTAESVDAATTLSGLKPGTKYSYQVAAVQEGSRTPGPWSSYVTFTTKR